MSKLEGKIAVITGATSGMGLATARLFISEGAHVYITGRHKDKLDEAVHDLGTIVSDGHAGVTGVQADSAVPDDLDRLFEVVKTGHGRVDVLYAAAGFGNPAEPLSAVTADSYDHSFNLNVRGTLFTVQKALPLIPNGGSIILNGLAGSVKGFPGATLYNSSKTALRSLVRTWTSELTDRHIRVNILSPGAIDTPALARQPDAVRARIASLVPAGRLGHPEEVATAALFLASADSSFVYGSDMPVAGGIAQI